jgi:hypothetical protein
MRDEEGGIERLRDREMEIKEWGKVCETNLGILRLIGCKIEERNFLAGGINSWDSKIGWW